MANNKNIPSFDKILDEIEEVVMGLNQEGAQLLTLGKYDEARALIEKVESINVINNKVKALVDDWRKLSIKPAKKKVRKARKPKPKSTSTSRLEKGLRTSEESLKIPLLKTLVKMGGAGKVSDVLDNMEPLIKDILNEVDYEPLQSTNELRWRNTTKWARADMIKEGLLDENSPYGIWTITTKGKQWLGEKDMKYQNGKENRLNKNSHPLPVRIKHKTKAKGLQQIIEVCHEMFKGGKNYNEAVEVIASAWNLKSVHTVEDACTRRIGLNTQEFKLMTKDRNKLIQFLIKKFPNEKHFIIEQLSS